MHLLIEILTLAFFLGTGIHAVILRGRSGAAFFGAMVLMGLLRETFVLRQDILYGFSPLHIRLGKVPLIAIIVWGCSIYAAVVGAEIISGERYGEERPSAKLLGLVALFMIALACFYEPFLKLIHLAKWQEGTSTTLDVPWITWIGYPSMAILFLLLWSWAQKRSSPGKRAAALLIFLPLITIGHAWGLQVVKTALEW